LNVKYVPAINCQGYKQILPKSLF